MPQTSQNPQATNKTLKNGKKLWPSTPHQGKGSTYNATLLPPRERTKKSPTKKEILMNGINPRKPSPSNYKVYWP
jgi:hypothetical protein